MISTINGTVRSIHSDRLVIEVGGVGLSVLVNASTSNGATMGTQVQLFTSLVVREDSLTLFGFSTDEARSLFELLQFVTLTFVTLTGLHLMHLSSHLQSNTSSPFTKLCRDGTRLKSKL